ncbi:ATP-dependent helicase HrpB [Microvirga sp. W0021]|uniref:ATP-dependent helicase HrpB n=1 Tax=Hohaiivirga grylli TaxID=3133970 RepID=A0ABV0BJP3_9HYPH
MRTFKQPLPVDAILEDISRHFATETRLVVVAPPGAGKTTRIPLWLLDEPWMDGKKLIILEPRRLAARSAAEQMARTLGESVGETVGLRVRMSSKVSTKTRIEVVTEGVFSRMILDDPELNGIAAILFDEFHERSLDADLGLAFAIDCQSGLRDDLRLLVMSATLDGARVSKLLDDAAIIHSEGRSYPVDTRYIGRTPQSRIEDDINMAIRKALREESGSVLVFLPGQGEIRRVETLLKEWVDTDTIDVAPLYGTLDRKMQDLAVSPSTAGRRKIVLATSIAETSLTIEGIRVVIDSGLARIPVYEPDIGLTRLETVRVSKAAADQRRGRAGRLEAGVCYRLWEEAATGAMEAFARPEILAADLSSLLLDCLTWGVTDPNTLPFLDAPPTPALNEARALLQDIAAIDDNGRLTALGSSIQKLPLSPRLAAMVLQASAAGRGQEGANLAALLVERGIGGDNADLDDRYERFLRDRSQRAEETRRLAENWSRAANKYTKDTPSRLPEGDGLGVLVALAYPDRIAKVRGATGEYIMSNGRGAMLDAHDRLAKAPFLAIAEISGKATKARIIAAAPITLEEIIALHPELGTEREEVYFDKSARAVRARASKRYGVVVLNDRPLSVPNSDETAHILAQGILSIGLKALPWSKALLQWRERVMFLRNAAPDEWPDISDRALGESMDSWLVPYLAGKTAISDIQTDELTNAIHGLLPWNMQKKLEQEAPTHFEAPTGSSIPIDYSSEGGPSIAIRVQELFGQKIHPSLAGGKIPLTLHLLSPAHRPIQITRDLPGFWQGSWAEVKTDMRGRYPKHPWPDDPAVAEPTRRAKPRGT